MGPTNASEGQRSAFFSVAVFVASRAFHSSWAALFCSWLRVVLFSLSLKPEPFASERVRHGTSKAGV
jgi:hypothetical protein